MEYYLEDYSTYSIIIKNNVDFLMQYYKTPTVNIKIGTINIRRYKKFNLYNFEMIDLTEHITFKQFREIKKILRLFNNSTIYDTENNPYK
jgi:hypothetical protein